jgi:hypothetical protein
VEAYCEGVNIQGSSTCRPGIESRATKRGFNFLDFGPDACLWLTHSFPTKPQLFPWCAPQILTTFHVEAPIQPMTVDLGHADLNLPDLGASYHITPKGHITPST